MFMNFLGPKFVGVVLEFFRSVFIDHNKPDAVYEVFSRTDLPNLKGLLSTVIVGIALIYLQVTKECFNLKYNREIYIKSKVNTNFPITIFRND